MTRNSPTPSYPRAAAEARLSGAPSEMPPLSSESLLHELQVHQIELEMQNEALRQTQMELEAARDRYVDLYEFAPMGYLTLTRDGVIEEVNLAGASLLGGERDKLPGRAFLEFVTREDRERWRGQFATALGSESRHGFELRLRRADGAVFQARLDCLVMARGGNPAALRVSVVDISELARLHQALQRSEEHYRRLARISPAGIIDADALGACIYVNERWCELSGLALAECLGDGWKSSLHPNDHERALEYWQSAMAARQPTFVEWRFLRPDGKVSWIVGELVAEHDELGRVVGMLGVVGDFTAQHEQEQRRQAAESAQRDALVREVHHRIKNTMQSVAGLLRRELGHFKEFDSRLETAITQMSAIAVVHGLQSANAVEAVRLCDTVAQICKTVEAQTQRAIDWAGGNATHLSGSVRVDRSEAVAIALVINELVLNAAKHSPLAGPVIRVELHTDELRARLVIRNALAKPREFDFETGSGLDTGLSLVRSLLPERGVELRYFDGEEGGFLMTELMLSPPVLQATAAPREG